MASREQESQLLASLNKTVGKSWSEVRKAPPSSQGRLAVPEGTYPMQLLSITYKVDPKEKFPIFLLKLVVRAPREFAGQTGSKRYQIKGGKRKDGTTWSAADDMARFIGDMKVVWPDYDYDQMSTGDIPALFAEVSKAQPFLKIFAKENANPQYGSDLFINGRMTEDEVAQIEDEVHDAPGDTGDPGDSDQPSNDEPEPDDDSGSDFTPAVKEKYHYPADENDGTPVYTVTALDADERTCTLTAVKADPKTKRKEVLKGIGFDDLGSYVD